MKKSAGTPKSFRGKLLLNVLLSAVTGVIFAFLVFGFFHVAVAIFAAKSFGGIIMLGLMACVVLFYAYYWFWLSYESIRDNVLKGKIVRGVLPKLFLNYGRYEVVEMGPNGKRWEWRTFREGCARRSCRRCSHIIYEWDWVETEADAQAAAEQSLSEYRWHLAHEYAEDNMSLPGTTFWVHSIEAYGRPHPKSADKEYFAKLEKSTQKFLEACQKILDKNPE